MAVASRIIEIQFGLDLLGIDSAQIPFETIEAIALTRVAEAQLVQRQGTELMRKIYDLRQAGIESPKDVAAALDITLRGAQTWVGILDQWLIRIGENVCEERWLFANIKDGILHI